jgi:hypothetical protein
MASAFSDIGIVVSDTGKDIPLAGNQISLESDDAGHLGNVAGLVSDETRFQVDEGK